MSKTETTPRQNDATTVVERLEHPMAMYQILIGVTAILLCSGVVWVASASSIYAYTSTGSEWAIVQKQAMFAVLGVGVMSWASRVNITFLRRISPYFLMSVVFALALVLVIGTSVYGQKNWIAIGSFRLQPSEFAKLALILWSADHFARREGQLHIRSRLLNQYGIVAGTILGLVVLEDDLGTAMVMMPIVAGMLFFVGAPAKWFGYFIGLALTAIIGLSIAEPYRMERFASWLNPASDPSGAGFQVLHGQRALGSGGWLGVGLGASREKWGTLPEAHTDFIYAVIGEEGGIFCTLLVLALFVAIILIGIRIANTSPDRFVQLASLGIVTWITTQVLVNIGAVLGILPVTGVPLPLVSYGGSSLIPTLCALGILMRFARLHAVQATKE